MSRYNAKIRDKSQETACGQPFRNQADVPVLMIDIVLHLDRFQVKLLIILLCCGQNLFICIT